MKKFMLYNASGHPISQDGVEVVGDYGNVVAEMTTEIPDKPEFKMPPQKMVQQRFSRRRSENDPTVPGGSQKIGDESITIAGRKLDCEVYETKMAMRGKTLVTRTYICKDVPGWTVRVDNDSSGEMQTVTEAVEFKQ